MQILILLLGISLIIATGFLIAFLWGVKTGQFEDDYSPAHKIFFNHKTKPNK
jgi:cbb3-type cytochrome oxidase maturation protein